jgi:hypothetical protein
LLSDIRIDCDCISKGLLYFITLKIALGLIYMKAPYMLNCMQRVRFEVFTAVTMKNAVFWDVTPCGSCKNRRFGGTHHLHLQGGKSTEKQLISSDMLGITGLCAENRSPSTPKVNIFETQEILRYRSTA